MTTTIKPADTLPHRCIKGGLLFAGTFFLGLGIIGIFIPLLPTTPFLLLSAACYMRSSTKFYHILINNKWFGTYIKNYQEGNGIPLKIKIISLFFLWITILISTIYFIPILFVQIILLIIAIAVTLHILLIKTAAH
ncbi:MAG: YbaN family protein [Candidatus Thermoplasmatota archaeon]|nr:YbaN family protein [Candidatus Thermoplasmatota archaeon]MBU1862834.1 YbaN family protein [Candidatus Omnitrophota bacterium]